MAGEGPRRLHRSLEDALRRGAPRLVRRRVALAGAGPRGIAQQLEARVGPAARRPCLRSACGERERRAQAVRERGELVEPEVGAEGVDQRGGAGSRAGDACELGEHGAVDARELHGTGDASGP